VLFDAGLSVITWPEKYGGRDEDGRRLAAQRTEDLEFASTVRGAGFWAVPLRP